MKPLFKPLAFLSLAFLSACTWPFGVTRTPEDMTPPEQLEFLKESVAAGALAFPLPPGTRIDTVIINDSTKTLTLSVSKELSFLPLRPADVDALYTAVKYQIPAFVPEYSIMVESLGRPVEELVPNYFRPDTTRFDRARLARPAPRGNPVVWNFNKPYRPVKGLYNRNIIVWHSHGWYYNNDVDRWEWQRPRLFESVEDVIPMSFVLPYLAPMLERAGANVFLPRERDTQIHEVIVDNDSMSSGYSESAKDSSNKWRIADTTGFAIGSVPYDSTINPFKLGTARVVLSDTALTAAATFTPNIPASGAYGVTISYTASPENSDSVHLIVYHEGGSTDYIVNQTIGGGTWIYVGTFEFRKGIHPDSGRVVVVNKSAARGKTISVDAVRFGGGVGVVARNGRTSGRPKYLEGARYWLQFAGMPDTMVYNLNYNRNDYRDDYQSRAEYGNYLFGAPFGPNKDRNMRGLGIPMDASIAFHTDAGITRNDTTVGTLLIYTIVGTDTTDVFPDSVSRFANRDFADILQTQIVNDIRALYDPAWSRRQLRDADYSESTRPNIPSVLVELLSHQNFLDMKFVLDPTFRFHASRAMYKGVLRFLATQYRIPYVVQPLPVTHMSAIVDGAGDAIVRWKPADDPLERTAAPDRYIVYTRIGAGGFDNGTLVTTPYYVLRNIKPGIIYSFKVAAVNDGGESFDSEILSVSRGVNGQKPALVINGFTRVGPPAWVHTDSFSGFLGFYDAGVQDRYGFNFTGFQHDFDPNSQFRSNDAPGHGASWADFETKLIMGNTFDYPAVHGAALLANGIPFHSASVAAVMDSLIPLADYSFVDLILGEQLRTPWQKQVMDSIRGTRFEAFPPTLRTRIADYCSSGGGFFVSGAYIGTDMFKGSPIDSAAVRFAASTLKYVWGANHASRTGNVTGANGLFFGKGKEIVFNTDPSGPVYAVEAPDALLPIRGGATLLRYAENEFSAAVGYRNSTYGVVACGFPFETILDSGVRVSLMKAIVEYTTKR